MNMQMIMAQAKKLQKELENTTREIEQKDYSFDNEYLSIIAKGSNEISKISIKDDNILSDKEIFEDMLIVGINNVLEQIKKEKNEKLGKQTGGLGGLF